MNLIIFGIGNYAEPIIELCQDCGHSIAGLYHYNSDRTGEIVMGYKILGDYNDFLNHTSEGNIVVAIGDNKLRSEKLNYFRSLGYQTPSIIHPTAYISNSAILGKGVYIHAKAFVWTKSIIENNVVISPNAMIAHHAQIAEGCLISANSVVGSYVRLDKRVMVGINAGIISKSIVIGSDTMIGANAMVINGVEPNSIMIGTPAKPTIRDTHNK